MSLQMSGALLAQIFFLLESDSCADISDATGLSASAVTHELVALALLTIRYLPESSALYPHIARILKVLFGLQDGVVQTRLFAEVAVVLVNASVEQRAEEQNAAAPVAAGGAAPVVGFEFAQSPIGQMLKDPSVTSHMHNRLLAAIARTLHRTLDLSLSVLAHYIPLSSGSGGEAEFTATSAASEDSLFASLVDTSEEASTMGASSSSSSRDSDPHPHPWSLFSNEIFISRNTLFRLRLRALAGTVTDQDSFSADVLRAELKALCGLVVRQLQGVLFILKTCGER